MPTYSAVIFFITHLLKRPYLNYLHSRRLLLFSFVIFEKTVKVCAIELGKCFIYPIRYHSWRHNLVKVIENINYCDIITVNMRYMHEL